MDFDCIEAETKLYLKSTSYLMHIPEVDFRRKLTDLYNSDNEVKKAVASILNAIYTDGLPTFCISLRSFTELISSDKNLRYKGRIGINMSKQNLNKVYGTLVHKLFAESTDWEIICSQHQFRPHLVSMVNESIIGQMGHQMTIKLASNGYQMAIKIFQANESKGESGKGRPVLDIYIDMVGTHQTPSQNQQEVKNENSIPETEIITSWDILSSCISEVLSYNPDIALRVSRNQSGFIEMIDLMKCKGQTRQIILAHKDRIIAKLTPDKRNKDWKENIERVFEIAVYAVFPVETQKSTPVHDIVVLTDNDITEICG